VRMLAAAALLVAAQPALAASLTVRISGVEEAAGRLQVAVCSKSFDKAGCPYGASEAAVVPGLDVHFGDLPPGSYAVAVYQDQDGSGELNRNMLGLPTEPYGFSNDIGRLGPPQFADALVDVQGDTVIEVTVRPLFGGG
jgi:uncharacterized protein (DUF2141 family)